MAYKAVAVYEICSKVLGGCLKGGYALLVVLVFDVNPNVVVG